EELGCNGFDEEVLSREIVGQHDDSRCEEQGYEDCGEQDHSRPGHRNDACRVPDFGNEVCEERSIDDHCGSVRCWRRVDACEEVSFVGEYDRFVDRPGNSCGDRNVECEDLRTCRGGDVLGDECQ